MADEEETQAMVVGNSQEEEETQAMETADEVGQKLCSQVTTAQLLHGLNDHEQFPILFCVDRPDFREV
jgi:hypothetical protein